MRDTTAKAVGAIPDGSVRAGLKSWFVVPFFTVQTSIFGYALWNLWQRGYSLEWVGAALSAGAVIGFLAFVVGLRRARTSSNLSGVLTSSGLGTVLALAAVARGGAVLPVGGSLVAFAGTVLYVFWYSRFGRWPATGLTVGNELPDFEVEDCEGKPVRASSLRGRPVVWLFFRGNWCPLCMAQIREIAAEYKSLAARGVDVVLISPQSHENTRALAERFEVPLRFLVDRGLRAARRLGIAHFGGLPIGMRWMGYEADTVLPTVVITDAAGTILMSDQSDNYRVRPEPSTFLEVLDAAGAEPAAA